MNIDLVVFIKWGKFLRILNYSQSFQEQVVTFSSVICTVTLCYVLHQTQCCIFSDIQHY